MVRLNPVFMNFFDTIGKMKDNQEIEIWKKARETQEEAYTKEIQLVEVV